MCGTIVFIAAATLGIDPGWERLEDGGWRYLIQIDPDALEDLKAGRVFLESDIPPQLKDVRSYRITVGRKKLPQPQLPRLLPPAKRVAVAAPKRAEPGPSARVRPEIPGRLPPGRNVKPLQDRPASFSAQMPDKPRLESEGTTAPGPDTEESTRPWMPFTFALSAAFGCFGGMIYLGWIALDYRKRYRELYLRLLESGAETACQAG